MRKSASKDGKYSGIERALRNGCLLRCYLLPSRLRVASVERSRVIKGYGENTNITNALQNADSYYLSKGRVSGGCDYEIGPETSSGTLDSLILQGQQMEAWFEKGCFTVEVKGYANVEIPPEISRLVEERGQRIIWKDRGYTYKAYREFLPDGSLCTIAKVLRPSDYERPFNPWFYKVKGKGFGKTLDEALLDAAAGRQCEDSFDEL